MQTKTAQYQLSERDKAIVALLWDYLKRDPEYKDRRQTGFGTKTQYGLARSIDAIYSEYSEDGTERGKK